jgi:transcription antitermination protein NusB
MTKVCARARHQARRKALQALYQWHIASTDINEVLLAAHIDLDVKKVDIEFLNAVVRGVEQDYVKYDEMITQHLDRAFAQLDPIELNILRIATFELVERIDNPYKVVLNEALELAKAFGGQDGHKYVNGVLEHLAKLLRPIEFNAQHTQ